MAKVAKSEEEFIQRCTSSGGTLLNEFVGIGNDFGEWISQPKNRRWTIRGDVDNVHGDDGTVFEVNEKFKFANDNQYMTQYEITRSDDKGFRQIYKHMLTCKRK